MPVTSAYCRLVPEYDKDVFYTVARTAGYNVNKRDGQWYEQTPD